ncbi:DUF4190 domain-containing protein [Cellulomonas sp. NPDC089187]|uniref:DUF4190 domain-containing protein n=1 Tax=Cellulomonas sp. NPDC089187 TaxID=3154970 RepID=UPI003420DCAB
MSNDATPTTPDPYGGGTPQEPTAPQYPGAESTPAPRFGADTPAPSYGSDAPAPGYGTGAPASQYPGSPAPAPSGATAPQYGGAPTGSPTAGQAPQFSGASQYPAPGMPTQPFQPPAKRPTDGMSIAALVVGLIGGSLIAIVLGILGLRRTKNGERGGRGMAIAGIILGAVTTVVWTIVIIIAIAASTALSNERAELRDECASGEMSSCDVLYLRADATNADEEFGATCGDRTGSSDLDITPGTCSWYQVENGELVDPLDFGDLGTDLGSDDTADDLDDSTDLSDYAGILDAETYGDNAVLDGYWDECEAGDDSSCDTLYMVAPSGSEYESFGDTCGGRQEASTGEYCSF